MLKAIVVVSMKYINDKLKEIAELIKEDLYFLENRFVFPVGELAEKIGLKIEFVDLPEGQAGKLENKIIYVNDNYSGTRNLFTIAHEIGHYIINLKKNINIDKNRFDNKREYTEEELKEEREANDFAAELLMPKEEFKKNFINYEGNLTKLADYFGVSRVACEYRAMNLGFRNSI